MGVLIIGIDPGTTLGYAILDINKKILEIGSSKIFRYNDLIKKVNDFGKPLIIGTDKKKTPSFVSKFASQFQARVISPKEDLLVKEKNKLTEDYKLNNHEKDALAAALYAYSQHDKLFSKIDYHLKKFDSNIIEKVKALCVKDELSISLSLDLVTKPEEEMKEIKKIIHRDNLKKDLIFLYEKIKKQKKNIELLRKNITKKKKIIKKVNEINHLILKKNNQLFVEMKVKRLLNLRESNIISLSKEVKSKEESIDTLKNEIRHLYIFFSDISENYIVKKLRNLGYEEFMRKNKLLKIKKNDILLVDNINIVNNRILEFLKDKIDVIIYKEGDRRIKDITLVRADKLKIKEDKYFALVDKKKFERERNNVRLLRDIVKDYKRTRQASIHQNL